MTQELKPTVNRWEVGMRNIATILVGPRADFEITDLVEKVRALAAAPRPSADADAAGVVETLDELRKQGGKTWLDKADFEALDAAIAALVASQPPDGEPVDYWAVHSRTGSHIGLWKDETFARNVLKEYDGGVITPLYAQPPAPVVTDAMIRSWLSIVDEVEIGPEPEGSLLALRAALTAALTTKGDAE